MTAVKKKKEKKRNGQENDSHAQGGAATSLCTLDVAVKNVSHLKSDKLDIPHTC